MFDTGVSFLWFTSLTVLGWLDFHHLLLTLFTCCKEVVVVIVCFPPFFATWGQIWGSRRKLNSVRGWHSPRRGHNIFSRWCSPSSFSAPRSSFSAPSGTDGRWSAPSSLNRSLAFHKQKRGCSLGSCMALTFLWCLKSKIRSASIDCCADPRLTWRVISSASIDSCVDLWRIFWRESSCPRKTLAVNSKTKDGAYWRQRNSIVLLVMGSFQQFIFT